MPKPFFDAGLYDSQFAESMGLRAYTAQDFITKALRLLNVIDIISTPAPEQLMAGYDILNEMIDDWRTQSALVLIIAPYRHQLLAHKQSYLIGPGGDWDQARPSEITRWSAILDRTANPIIRIPHARAMTLPEWQLVAMQTVEGSIPQALYYDRGFNAFGQGTVYVYPVPDNSICDIELWLPMPMVGFAGLTNQYVFPPGYTRAIRYSLAVELANDFPGALTEGVAKVASTSIANIKRNNFRPRYAEFDRALVGSRGRRYDPYTDT